MKRNLSFQAGSSTSIPQKGELPYAWVIVALAFLTSAVTMAIRSTIGLLFKPWENEFGWDRAAMSLTASVGFLAFGLTQPFVGRWADRYGPRLVYLGSLLLLGFSSVVMGFVQSLWQVYLVFGVALMMSVAGTTNVTAGVAINRWVRRRKALAIAVVMAGAAAGQLALRLIVEVMQRVGWRTTFIWSGIGVLTLLIPVMFFLFKDDPPGHTEAQATKGGVDRLQSLSEIIQQKNFGWLAGSFWICGVTTAGLIDPHLIPYAEDLHIDTVMAATAFGVLSTFNVLGTLLAGVISDKWGHKWVLGGVYAGRALTLILLLLVREPWMLFVFAVTFGIVDFATVPPTTALSTSLFGRRSGGTVIGLVSLSHQVGSAVGSYAGGLIHDETGSYRLFFLGAALLCIAAAIMSWVISEKPRSIHREPSLI
ncbi:MAG TPA: MFS transporter [Candidatus Limnocylindrales bacterium]|nr:MFS transporter [Candidatus Limnocylindrales bacterium]